MLGDRSGPGVAAPMARLFASYVLLALLALPAPAGAATAEVRTTTVTSDDPKSGPFTTTVARFAYAAAAGERNAPVVAVEAAGRSLTLRDAGVALVAGSGCTALGADTVRCVAPASLPAPTAFLVELGDGADAVSMPPAAAGARVDAGPGDDQVAIAAGQAMGGDGNDVLRATGAGVALDGGPGADTLLGGPHDDALTGGPGRDRIDGGPGADSVGYGTETAPVTVDLRAPGSGGPAREPDDLRNLEGVSGGAGDDVLRGTAGADTLLGGAGDDLIAGRDGPDFLEGEEGADRVLGGPGRDSVSDFAARPSRGRDVLDGGPGEDSVRYPYAGGVVLGGTGDDELDFAAGASRVDGGGGNDLLRTEESTLAPIVARCGAGWDRISGPRARTVVPRDCEIVLVGPGADPDIPVRARLALRGIRLVLPLPNLCDGGRCRMRVEVRVRGVRIARAVRRVHLRAGGPATVELTPAARRRLVRADRVVLRFRAPDVPRTAAIALPPPRR
jgi:RTX calcium-binding nonapeptide repeat (4 copies)